jgi:hypothetical protein
MTMRIILFEIDPGPSVTGHVCCVFIYLLLGTAVESVIWAGLGNIVSNLETPA